MVAAVAAAAAAVAAAVVSTGVVSCHHSGPSGGGGLCLPGYVHLWSALVLVCALSFPVSHVASLSVAHSSLFV